MVPFASNGCQGNHAGASTTVVQVSCCITSKSHQHNEQLTRTIKLTRRVITVLLYLIKNNNWYLHFILVQLRLMNYVFMPGVLDILIYSVVPDFDFTLVDFFG